MQKLQATIYAIIILSGLFMAALALYDQNGEELNIVVRDGHTFVNGVLAPHLSDIPFHGAFIDDKTCLACHEKSREINLLGEIYVAQKMKHELRNNCDRCHHPANH
ncbi:MAG: hypothetical protein GWO85_00850 [Simkaniaceae bacterium]|nr:hypothetical protein [Simkaniaceae bacterium]